MSPLFLVQELQTQLLVPVSKYFVTVLLQLGPGGGGEKGAGVLLALWASTVPGSAMRVW